MWLTIIVEYLVYKIVKKMIVDPIVAMVVKFIKK